MKLALLDTSAFVHAGHFNRYAVLEAIKCEGTQYFTQVTPVGGASLIFNLLYNQIDPDTIVIACCDSNPTIKKSMVPGYKGDRTHERDMECDKAATEYILEKCGVTTVKIPGYEADDIIASYVKRFSPSVEQTDIYTADSDLFYLVNDMPRVNIQPSNSCAKLVTRENYEQTKVHGERHVYNTITAQKICDGDKTDCLPPLSPTMQEFFAGTLNSMGVDAFRKCGDKEFLLRTFKDYPEIMHQIECVFPLDVDAELPTSSAPNREAIVNWGKAMNNSNFRHYSYVGGFDADKEIEALQAEGHFLEQ